jgi:activating signal cointegrator complex subunit 2
VTPNPAIRQVLDILPDENPKFIEMCLAHPSFSGSVERVIGALLEGAPLPDGLDSFRYMVRSTPPMQEPSLVDSRKNAFEDDPLDFSKLKIGKNRYDSDDGSAISVVVEPEGVVPERKMRTLLSRTKRSLWI